MIRITVNGKDHHSEAGQELGVFLRTAELVLGFHLRAAVTGAAGSAKLKHQEPFLPLPRRKSAASARRVCQKVTGSRAR